MADVLNAQLVEPRAKMVRGGFISIERLEAVNNDRLCEKEQIRGP